jgi:hypothetical protein
MSLVKASLGPNNAPRQDSDNSGEKKTKNVLDYSAI